MPNYKNITLEDLQNWLKSIKDLCDKLALNPDIFLIAQLCISLYEYCQILCYFKINNITDKADNFKATISEIKSVVSDETLNTTANAFMSVRHLLAHGYISENACNKIAILFYDLKFLDLLRRINLDSDLLSKIELVLIRFKVFNLDQNLSNCNDECIKLFNFQEDGWSDSTIGSVIKELRNDFDDTTILNTLENILGNAIYHKN